MSRVKKRNKRMIQKFLKTIYPDLKLKWWQKLAIKLIFVFAAKQGSGKSTIVKILGEIDSML